MKKRYVRTHETDVFKAVKMNMKEVRICYINKKSQNP